MMHAFWKETDPGDADADDEFMKNLSLLGGALFVAYFGAGPSASMLVEVAERHESERVAGRHVRTDGLALG